MENKTVTKVKSNLLLVSRGVPQGSVLRPVLYILLTNDLPRYLQNHCKIVIYAVDTARLWQTRTVACNVTKQYCHVNDLVLNYAKTQQVLTPTPNQHRGLPEITTRKYGKCLGLIRSKPFIGASYKPTLPQNQ